MVISAKTRDWTEVAELINTLSISSLLCSGSALYSFFSRDHTHYTTGGEKGAWFSELRNVYCEEVMRRGTLATDSESQRVCVCVFMIQHLPSVVAMLLVGVARTRPPLTSSPPQASSPTDHTGPLMIIRYLTRDYWARLLRRLLTSGMGSDWGCCLSPRPHSPTLPHSHHFSLITSHTHQTPCWGLIG